MVSLIMHSLIIHVNRAFKMAVQGKNKLLAMMNGRKRKEDSGLKIFSEIKLQANIMYWWKNYD